MDPRVKELQDRILVLKSYIEAEERQPDKSLNYINDLKESIKSCRSQIGYLKKNPDGFEMVNGC